MATFEIKGRILNSLTKEGIESCRIELWVQNSTETFNLSLTTLSVSDGSYNLYGTVVNVPIKYTHFFLKIILDSQVLKETEPMDIALIKDKVYEIDVFIDVVSVNGNMKVFGRITDAFGYNVPDTTVKIFDKNFADITPTELGSCETDGNGYYLIGYSYSNPSKSKPDLIVKVYDEKEGILATSPLFLSADSHLEVNLSPSYEYKGVTSFKADFMRMNSDTELYSSILKPSLSDSARIEKINSLTGQDIAYIANKIKVNSPVVIQVLDIAYFLSKINYYSDENINLLYALNFEKEDGFNILISKKKTELVNKIQQSIDANIIFGYSPTTISTFVSTLKTKLVDYLAGTTGTAIHQMFITLGITDINAKKVIIDTILAQPESPDPQNFDFVSQLKLKIGTPPSLTSSVVDKIEYFLIASKFTDSSMIVVNLYNGGYTTLDSLMSISWNNLINILNANKEYFPEQDNTPIEYACAIFNNIDFEYPERFFIRRVLLEAAFPSTITKQFFNLNPDFPIFSNCVEVLFENGVDLTGFSSDNIAQIKLEIQRLQGFSTIAPPNDRINTVKALWKMGLDNVLSVERYSKQDFISSFKSNYVPYNGLAYQSETSAEYAYNAAVTLLLNTLNTYAAYSNVVNKLSPRFTDIYPAFDSQPSSSGTPNFSDLFDDNNFCRCKTGRSILSPAAYLADLLNFELNSGQRIFDVLTRRKDIKELLLNEKNTFTQLPYIDLVNEILGNAISDNASVYNTTLDEQSISAIPEHLSKLNSAIERINNTNNKAWGLPFHYWLNEYRAWCNQLSLPRYKLMELFPYGDSLSQHSTFEISSEYLRLSSRQVSKLLYNDLDTLQDMNYYNQTTDELKNVSNFLKSSGLTLDELKLFLTSYHVNPNTGTGASVKRISIILGVDSGIQSCDLNEAELKYSCNGSNENISTQEFEKFLKRIYKYAHLYKQLKLSIPELDLLLLHEGYCGTQWDNNMIIAIAEKIRFMEDISISLEDMILFYGDFSELIYSDNVNLYNSLFTNSSLKILSDDLNTLSLNDEKVKHLICGALEINETDYHYLLKELSLVTNGVYQLATKSNLARLYGCYRFTRLLKISLREYFKLVSVNNYVSPVKTIDQTPSIKQTREFLEYYNNLVKRDITVDEIYTLLSATRINRVKTVHTIPDPVEFCTIIGSKLFEEKVKLELDLGVHQDFEKFRDSYIETISCFLDSVVGLDQEKIDTVFSILDSPILGLEAQDFIRANFTSFCNSDTFAIELTNGTIEEKYKYLLNEIIHFKLRPIVFNEFSLEFDISDALVNKILTCWIETPSANSSLKAIEFFINNEQIAEFNPEHQTARAFGSRIEQLDRFTKAAWFINKYRMNEVACEFIYNSFKNGVDHQILNIFNLPIFELEESEIVPINEEISTRSAFEFEQDILIRWNNLDTAFRLDNALSLTPRTLFTIWNTCTFEGFDQLELLNELSRTTGWNVNHIGFLVQTIDENLRFTTITWIKQLAEKLFVSSILGLAPQAIVKTNLPDTDITNLQVQVLRGAVKSKFSLNQWLKVAKSIMDPLRRDLRDAFLSYLLTNNLGEITFSSVNEIYDHFLIDPLMEPCSKTSRIVQATLSIQLFVQRVLLNLEINSISEEAKEKWTWHKNYRIWEACRKIFLYPENWLEPDWRKNKSEFFTELNDYIIENDITSETAEKALADYLDKIAEVSDLEVISMYKEENERELTKIHFLGKTRSFPNKYYYRWFDTKIWSYWQKVEIDIDSSNVTLAKWNDRIYIFWPIISTTKAEDDSMDFDSLLELPSVKADGYTKDLFDTSVKIQLGYSYYSGSKWSKKKISEVYHSFNHSIFFTIGTHGSNTNVLFPKVYKFDNDNQGIFLQFVGYDENKLELALAINRQQFNHNNVQYFSYTLAKIRIFKNDTVKFLVDNIKCVIDKNSRYVLSGGPKYLHRFHHHTSGQIINGRIRVEKGPNDHYSVRIFTSPYKNPIKILKDYQPDGISFETVANNLMFCFDDKCQVNLDNFHFNDSFLLPVCYTNSKHAYYSIPKKIQEKTGSRFYSLISSTLEDKPVSQLVINSTHKNNIYTESDKNTIVSSCKEELMILNSSNSETAYGVYKYESYPLDNWLINQIKECSKENILNIFDSEYKADSFEQQIILETSNSSWIKDKTEFSLEFGNEFPFGRYHWEMFYHIPILIANKLSTNQQFEDAQKWFHCVFDPTRISSSHSKGDVWKFKPFQLVSDETSDIRKYLHDPNLDQSFIDDWKKDPLDAHAIVKNRLMAYMRYTVMKYLDNLIAWGDYLFAQDSLETLNEATQIYILASEILGPKPALIETTLPDDKSFEQIYPLNSLSNSLFTITNSLIGTGGLDFITNFRYVYKDIKVETPVMTIFKSLYFGIPYNEKLIEYWDKVADRLFKLRNCMNLKGIVRDIPLFSPPIDPALLVQANAAGLNISKIIAGLNTSVGAYRYRYCMQKAKELTNEVIALGSSLLSALEKRDSEILALLKATHETCIQKAIRSIKEKAIEELQCTIESLELNIKNAEVRYKFYKERNPLITNEKLHLTKLERANQMQLSAQELIPLVSILGGIPQFIGGTLSGVETGGVQLRVPPQITVDKFNLLSSIFQYQAQVAAIKAGYDRRQEEWDFQANQADNEILSLQKQLLASKVRLAIAEHELNNHDILIEQSEEYYSFLKEKFTNKELYDWMVTDLSSIYFQSYKLANEFAKQAELTYRFEINAPTTNTFISYGHWDNLKKGLMSGERLRSELNMLDKAYTEANIRKLEITKLYSLMLFNPVALKDLKITGSCEFTIPEFVYDLDYPGHYLRRIKSVAISIPAVIAPNSSVACKLTLLENSYRVSAKVEGIGYPEGESDNRFVYNPITLQSIVTSSAQNDRGIFEFNFNDERYLPFEGAGAISRWRIELPEEFRQFDYNTISDVILHINYTAEEDGTLKEHAIASLKTIFAQSIQEQVLQTSFNWKAVYPECLYQLNTPSVNSANFRITINQFPAFIIDYLKRTTPEVDLSILGVEIVVPGDFNGLQVGLKNLSGTTLASGGFTTLPANSQMCFSVASLTITPGIIFDPDGLELKLDFAGGNLDDILMILAFKVD
jgi:hypothetical protein